MATLFVSCKKKSTDTGANPPISGNTIDTIGTVYAAGYELSATTSKNMATYWRGSTAVRLSDGAKDAYATGITLVGNDVYVAGTVNGYATYWKNGVAIRLSNAESDANFIFLVKK